MAYKPRASQYKKGRAICQRCYNTGMEQIGWARILKYQDSIAQYQWFDRPSQDVSWLPKSPKNGLWVRCPTCNKGGAVRNFFESIDWSRVLELAQANS